MNFLSAILALLCLLVQDVQKPKPPSKGLAEKQEAILRSLGACAETFDERIKNMAKALELGQQAAKESDDTKAWALYRVSMENAKWAGEARLHHGFACEMADRWEMPSDFLPNWHIEAITWSRNAPTANNEARISELTHLMLEDLKSLGPKDFDEKWEEASTALRKLVAEAESEHTKRACGINFSKIKAWLWIAKEASKDNVDAAAFRLILTGKIPDGIKALENSGNRELSQIAKEVSESEEPFSSSHQRLLTLLAQSNNDAAKLSGQRIFESLLPNLTVEQIETCQPICFHMTEQLPLRGDFSLPYHGWLKNGYHPFAQEKTIPKGFTFDEEKQQWSCRGDGTLEWPRLPFENYVQEIELTVNELNNHVNLYFGTEDSTRILLHKKDDKIRARLSRHVGGRYNWKGSRSFAVGEKLVIKVYRTPERMFAFINGKKMNSRYFGLGWHKFRITVGKGSKATVSSIKTRPWLPGDREVLSKIAGTHKSIDMTASKFRPPSRTDYRKYLRDFKDIKEVPKRGESFMAYHDILMRPVAAAKFNRPGDQRQVSISKDFHCSAHEITQRQFSEVMEFNPASAQGNGYLPVDNVTMAEAIEFCERLTESLAKNDFVPDGYEYRLPTEAEWTLAAMADGKSDIDVPEAQWWHWGTSDGGFHMVGTSTASKRGLYDMHGNVEELTLTEHHKRKASKESETEELVDPVILPTAKSRVVVKGGSWNVGAHIGSASRRDRRHQGRTPGRGFRIVLAPTLE